MNTPSSPGTDWTLRHAWSSETDRAALRVAADELARQGIRFADAAAGATANAVKMHGFELVEAVRGAAPAPIDLGATAAAERWSERLDPRVWRFMTHGAAICGIPVALHQSNGLWAHGAIVDAVPAGGGLADWLANAAHIVAKPLAIGADPWQVGLLFESVALGVLGAAGYEQALVAQDPAALAGPGMVRVLDELLRLREHVDDGQLAQPWRTQFARVAERRAGVIVMGDWVGAALPGAMRRLRVDGFRDECVFVADFFVPVVDGAQSLSARVAKTLTGADFQARFAMTKGCQPPLLAAQSPFANTPTRIDAPSLTLDQCCGLRRKQALLAIAADHFVHRRDSARTARLLADAAEGSGASVFSV